MGDLAKGLMEHTIQQTLVAIVDDTMQSARCLHSLAQVLDEDPDWEDIANAAQLRESAARCLDVIELIIEAATADLDAYRKSRVHKDIQRMRKEILD